MTRPIPHGGDPAPEGYEYRVAVDTKWRLVTRSKPCRNQAGYHAPACGKPAVAELGRPRQPGPTNRQRGITATVQWWAYCPEHMYSRWVEDGKVLSWRLVEVGAP